ncbi:MAG: hypothetical protein WAM39_18555 [Bryobacteraceae bacterium]
MASRSHRVDAIVRCAHRRSLTLLGMERAALAVSLVFAGSAVILVAGTQLLSWYWLCFVAAIGLAGGAYRLRGRIPSAYDTAQTLDRRLALHDTVSTAWHINRHPEVGESAAGQYQLAQAEIAARNVNTAAVFPLALRRSWLMPLALGAVAFALFSVRYLVRRDLDFTQSLVPLHLETLAARLRNFAASDRSGPADPSDEKGDSQSGQPAASTPNNTRASDVTNLKDPASSDNGESASAGESPDPVGLNNAEPGSSAQSAANGNLRPGADRTTGEKSTPGNLGKAGNETSEARQASGEQQNSSLMNRMKDAVSSLLAKMRPSEGSERSAQSSTRNAAAPDQDRSQSDAGPSQSQTRSSQSSQSSAQTDSKNNEQGQATELAQSSQNRTSSSSDHPGGDQAKSGIGRQDGSKDLKESEEQQAMGKLAQIIGKRSRDVSGEMMVEVPSGKQELRTAYSGKLAQHSDTGGEINRDEIPLAFQEYIREYMERIHREPAQAKSAAPQH